MVRLNAPFGEGSQFAVLARVLDLEIEIKRSVGIAPSVRGPVLHPPLASVCDLTHGSSPNKRYSHLAIGNPAMPKCSLGLRNQLTQLAARQGG